MAFPATTSSGVFEYICVVLGCTIKLGANIAGVGKVAGWALRGEASRRCATTR